MNRRSRKNSGPVRVRSWKSIQQDVRRPVSGPRRNIGWRMGLIWAMAVTFSVALIFAAYVLLFEPQKLLSAGPDFRIEKLVLETDGVLNEEWLRDQLNVSKGDALLQAEIFQMRRKLLESGQVAECIVRKKLPETLEIRIIEREPILRIRSRDDAGNPITLLVARDGAVYRGHGYSRSTVRRLPFLSGIELIQTRRGYAPIPGFRRVADLIDTCRSRFPDLFREWRIIDLSLYDADPAASFSAIRVRSASVREILFATENYEDQLLRLRDILTIARERDAERIEKIDLRFEESVPTRFR